MTVPSIFDRLEFRLVSPHLTSPIPLSPSVEPGRDRAREATKAQSWRILSTQGKKKEARERGVPEAEPRIHGSAPGDYSLIPFPHPPRRRRLRLRTEVRIRALRFTSTSSRRKDLPKIRRFLRLGFLSAASDPVRGFLGTVSEPRLIARDTYLLGRMRSGLN